MGASNRSAALDAATRRQTEGVGQASNAPAWAAVLTRAVAIWLPIAAATTGLAVIVYGAYFTVVAPDLRGLRRQIRNPDVDVWPVLGSLAHA